MRAGQSPERKRAKRAWQTMKRRCLEPGFRSFTRYGGSGIRICPQWMDFPQFLSDMGVPPSPEHWLGRLDTSKHYTPDNTIWTLRNPQMRRRQYCRRVIVQGETLTAAEAGRLPGLPTRNTVLRRWEAGFSLQNPKLPKIYKRSMWLTHLGETLPLPIWAQRIGVPNSLLWSRINRGMPIELAMTPKRFRLPRARATSMKKQ